MLDYEEKNEINIGIRADGNNQIGLGHIIRTMALANELKKRNCKIYYIIKNDINVIEILKENDFNYITLDVDLELKKEIQIVNRIMDKHNIDILIGDASYIEESYLKKLNKDNKVVVIIDVIRNMKLDVDIIINGGIYATQYEKEVEEYDTTILLGTKYTLLREQFSSIGIRNIKKNVSSILITMGGSDVFGSTPFFTRAINDFSSVLDINIIVGKSFKNTCEIEALANRLSNVNLYYDVKNMAELMKNNDLAISAGGTTLYELAAIGTPTLAVTQAENQILQTTRFHEMGIVRYLGDVKEIPQEKFLNVLEDTIIKVDKRKEMSKLGQSYVDGKGTKRCASIILKEYAKKVLNR